MDKNKYELETTNQTGCPQQLPASYSETENSSPLTSTVEASAYIRLPLPIKM